MKIVKNNTYEAIISDFFYVNGDQSSKSFLVEHCHGQVHCSLKKLCVQKSTSLTARKTECSRYHL